MFIAALFTIAKSWNQPKCPETDDWIKKIWYIYTMEYYSAIKKDKIGPFAATWMDLEGIMLSEISQSRSEEHTSELQSRQYLVCRLLLEKKKISLLYRLYP